MKLRAMKFRLDPGVFMASFFTVSAEEERATIAWRPPGTLRVCSFSAGMNGNPFGAVTPRGSIQPRPFFKGCALKTKAAGSGKAKTGRNSRALLSTTRKDKVAEFS